MTTQIKPLYHTQPISRWKSSVRDHRGPSAHHSSVETLESGSRHSDDSVGLFGHDSTVGQSQRGTQSDMLTLKLPRAAQFVPFLFNLPNRFLLAQNHAAGHFLEAEICCNIANILAQFLIKITLSLLPEANSNSTLLRRLSLLKTELKPQELLTQKLTLAEERTHRPSSKASKSSSFTFPLPAKFNYSNG
ncbi:hypothetical protein F511_19053 [Dorcoceras hygrometricum]|uniref:Uncharacterized protein n=1 Tax=Dorcoceras hygrometricum TaxID=472368 RepID=A0A2Z7CAD6_9LAMI|nr:hypothetical protein F511_19053 [Dorcoceras hygrometricum]